MAQKKVLQMWNAKADSRAGVVQADLLLDPSGRLNRIDFKRLLRWRDDRNVFLSE